MITWADSQSSPARVDPLVLDLNRDGKVELKNAAFLTSTPTGSMSLPVGSTGRTRFWCSIRTSTARRTMEAADASPERGRPDCQRFPEGESCAEYCANLRFGWFLHQVAERSERGVFCLCVPIQPLDRASSGADSPSV